MKLIAIALLIVVLTAGCMPSALSPISSKTVKKASILALPDYGNVEGNKINLCYVNSDSYETRKLNTPIYRANSSFSSSFNCSGSYCSGYSSYSGTAWTQTHGAFRKTDFAAVRTESGAVYLLTEEVSSTYNDLVELGYEDFGPYLVSYSDSVSIEFIGETEFSHAHESHIVIRNKYTDDSGRNIDRVTGVRPYLEGLFVGTHYHIDYDEKIFNGLLWGVFSHDITATIVEQVDKTTVATYVVEGTVLEVMQTIADNHGGPFKTFLEGCF